MKRVTSARRTRAALPLALALTLVAALFATAVAQDETTIERTIDQIGDDAEEFLDANRADGFEPGEIDNNTRYLELTFTEKWNTDQAIGLIFRDLDIPADAVVTDARIEFSPYDASRDVDVPGDPGFGTGRFDVTVALHDATTYAAEGFPNQGRGVDGPFGLISGLSTLPETVTWPVDGSAWGPDAPQRTVDLTPLVSAWLALPGYTPGSNAAVFRLTSPDSFGGAYAIATSERGARDPHGGQPDGQRAPTLVVSYRPAGSAPPAPQRDPDADAPVSPAVPPVPDEGGPEPATGDTAEPAEATTEPVPESATESATEDGRDGAPAELEGETLDVAPEVADPTGDTDAPEPAAEAAQPETDPATDATAEREEDAEPAPTQRVRYPLEPLGNRGLTGSVLLNAYPTGPLVLAVRLDENRGAGGDLRVELTQSCAPDAATLLELEPFSSASGFSVSQLEIGFATLRLSGFGVTVVDGASGAALGCATLAR